MTLEQFHERKLRRLLQINWEDHITSNAVLERGRTRSIEAIIRHRPRWSGHVVWMKLDSLDRSFSVNCQLENVLMDDHSSATKTNSNRRFRRRTSTSKPGKPSPGTVHYGGGQSMKDLIISREWEDKGLKRIKDNVEKPQPPYHLHRLRSSAINVPIFSGIVSVSSATNELYTLREPRCYLILGKEELPTSTTAAKQVTYRY